MVVCGFMHVQLHVLKQQLMHVRNQFFQIWPQLLCVVILGLMVCGDLSMLACGTVTPQHSAFCFKE